ncbi:MAG TPA: dienelactone hydrolase family protein, partial [Phnomibacter sp.]|nr:dienelactone hydrolase family protein [Phnomibacter sp.]
MQLRTSCMLVLGTLLTMATQAQKRKKNTPISLTTTGMACCIEEAEALPNSANTDALFAATATTAAFGKLHQEPLPFTLAAPKGAMQMFNCADGVPGMAYTIPAADASMNFLIVIQEWWGLNDHIKQEAERFYEALGGKVHVLAVDLYDGKVAASVDSAQKLIGAALQSKRKEAILMGAMDYAGKGSNIYTVGWCFGGMMSLQTAIMGGSRVRGAVMYYGTPEKNTAQIAKIQC